MQSPIKIFFKTFKPIVLKITGFPSFLSMMINNYIGIRNESKVKIGYRFLMKKAFGFKSKMPFQFSLGIRPKQKIAIKTQKKPHTLYRIIFNNKFAIQGALKFRFKYKSLLRIFINSKLAVQNEIKARLKTRFKMKNDIGIRSYVKMVCLFLLKYNEIEDMIYEEISDLPIKDIIYREVG